MSTTLTNGLKLPDKGSVDWYADMQNNYTILDTSVGTIAEHTTALAGKAPLVHTHSKADITDFPVLANVATSGSYNDLSNIPASFTPASHTHGNITNDGKVGTAANKPLITGTDGVVQAGSFGNAANTFCEGNDSRLSDARTPVAHTHTKSDITDLFNSANEWTGDNTFSGTNSFTAANININSSNFSLGGTVPSNRVKRFQWYDASNNRYACIAVNYATDLSVWIDIPLRTKNTEGTSFVDKAIRFQVKPDNTSAFLPVTNSVTDLGDSTHQWNNLYAKKVNTQSVNGINPGALSLPTTVYSDIDTTDWTLTGSTINYTPVLDGWVEINLNANANSFTRISVENIYYRHSSESQAGNQAMLTFPVRAGQTYGIKLWGSSILQARFIKCEGNV